MRKQGHKGQPCRPRRIFILRLFLLLILFLLLLRLIRQGQVIRNFQWQTQQQQQRRRQEHHSRLPSRPFFLTFADYNRSRNHVYAAAWWQSMERFRKMMEWIDDGLQHQNETNMERRFNKLEGACHLAVEYATSRDESGKDDVRLTRDWLAFGVEHLSAWWKMTRYQKHQAAYATLVNHLKEYLQQNQGQSTEATATATATAPASHLGGNPWRETIAIVAYHPLQGPRAPERAQAMDALVTASTIVSLMRQGCRRVVIIFDHGQEMYVSETLGPRIVSLLKRTDESRQSMSPSVPLRQKIALNISHGESGTSTLVFWPTDASVKDARGRRQIRAPRQALWTLYQAIQQPDGFDSIKVLDDGPWNFVYYTEQDSIMNARQDAATFTAFRQVLERDHLLIPHRWQLMPHATDFVRTTDMPASFFVPDKLPWNVVHKVDPTANDSLYTSCCDGGLGSTMSFANNNPPCDAGSYWYMCGFGNAGNQNTSFEHLHNFSLIKLQQGTRLTMLAASEHARRCEPCHSPCHG